MGIGGFTVVDMPLRSPCTGMVAVGINAANTIPSGEGGWGAHIWCGKTHAGGPMGVEIWRSAEP